MGTGGQCCGAQRESGFQGGSQADSVGTASGTGSIHQGRSRPSTVQCSVRSRCLFLDAESTQFSKQCCEPAVSGPEQGPGDAEASGPWMLPLRSLLCNPALAALLLPSPWSWAGPLISLEQSFSFSIMGGGWGEGQHLAGRMREILELIPRMQRGLHLAVAHSVSDVVECGAVGKQWWEVLPVSPGLGRCSINLVACL